MSKQIQSVGHCTGQLVWILQKYLCLEDKRGLGAFKKLKEGHESQKECVTLIGY